MEPTNEEAFIYGHIRKDLERDLSYDQLPLFLSLTACPKAPGHNIDTFSGNFYNFPKRYSNDQTKKLSEL